MCRGLETRYWRKYTYIRSLRITIGCEWSWKAACRDVSPGNASILEEGSLFFLCSLAFLCRLAERVEGNGGRRKRGEKRKVWRKSRKEGEMLRRVGNWPTGMQMGGRWKDRGVQR